jgi:peptidoglycan/xylan/chitin deacetylase (PgdA/CDA1 family)
LHRVTKGPALALAVVALAPHGHAARRPLPAAVPILEFHVIGDPAPGAPTPGLYDPAPAFRAQLAWLAHNGYTAVTLDEVFRSWRSGGWLPLPPRPVVLSFDDGYPQDVTVALPALRRRGWRGVLNLQIGNLVPKRVRELIDAGWEIDAHTFSHPDLTTVGASQLTREVAGSRRWLQAVFGVPADFFCYPYGRYDRTVVGAVERAGYLGAETEVPGAASASADPYTLPRLEVLRDSGVSGLAALLAQAKTRTSR